MWESQTVVKQQGSAESGLSNSALPLLKTEKAHGWKNTNRGCHLVTESPRSMVEFSDLQ